MPWPDAAAGGTGQNLATGDCLHPRDAGILGKEIAYDDMLRDFNNGFYAIYPSFSFQSSDRSDNERYLRLDKFRRLCGGLWRIQKLNEFYHRHRFLVIALHIIVVFLIIVSVV